MSLLPPVSLWWQKVSEGDILQSKQHNKIILSGNREMWVDRTFTVFLLKFGNSDAYLIFRTHCKMVTEVIQKYQVGLRGIRL